jgi:hypothetical protein
MNVAKASAAVLLTLALVAITAACGAAPGPSASTASVAAPSGPAKTHGTGSGSPTIPAASVAADCIFPVSLVAQHQAPGLEALLPARVGGRDLFTWSVRGRCWLEMAYGGTPTNIDALLADVDADDPSQKFDVTHLAMAVAGRSDTKADPPYFVFGMERGDSDEEIMFGLGVLLGGAGYLDPVGGSELSRYQEETISGKQVYVGETAMLRQDEHRRGRPYLYQTDDELFVVITDDDAWAAEALAQLP